MGASAGIVERILREQSFDFLMVELKDTLQTAKFWKEELAEACRAASSDAEFHATISDCPAKIHASTNVVQDVTWTPFGEP